MKKIIVSFLISSLFNTSTAQNIFIYHPLKGGAIKIYNSDKKAYDGKSLHFRQGEKFLIRLLNPNPLYYKYEINYAEQKEESEDKAITDALALLATALASRPVGGGGIDPSYDQYKGAINTLIDDIKLAQQIIDNSDIPEFESAALSGDRTAGLKYASDQILGRVQPGVQLQLLSAQYRFRSPTLAKDLEDLMGKIVSLDEILKRALQLLNASLVQKVTEIKKSMSDTQTEIDSEFTITDKTTKVFLSIIALDAKNSNIARPVTIAGTPLEIVTIIPDFKRSTLELIPVGNFLFAKDIKEFYVEDGMVQSRLKNKTSFAPGLVLNINLAQFGYSKQMSAGVGLGYKFSANNDALTNLYFSTLFSYKDFFRVGFGFGFASYPNSLKDGLIEGNLLPANIKNIEDVVEYKERPTAFLTIAFTGLNVSKKK